MLPLIFCDEISKYRRLVVIISLARVQQYLLKFVAIEEPIRQIQILNTNEIGLRKCRFAA